VEGPAISGLHPLEACELSGVPDPDDLHGGPEPAAWSALSLSSEPVDDLLAALPPGTAAVTAAWRGQLRDFEVGLSDGTRLLFRDCLQASFHRRPSDGPPWNVGGWWSDEPSPTLLSLDPRVRFLYRHLVLELGEGVLRVAFQRLERLESDREDGSV